MPFCLLTIWHSYSKYHTSAPSLRFISDYHLTMVQRHVFFWNKVLWLSDEADDWHFPVLITQSEQKRQYLEDR